MSELDRPSALTSPSWGTFTSNVNPAGVSARVVSGAAVIDGPNSIREQPVIVPKLVGAVTSRSGSCHDLAKYLPSRASPEHLVRFVKNGVRGLVTGRPCPPSSPNSS